MIRPGSLIWTVLLLLAVPAAIPAESTVRFSNEKVLVTEDSLKPGETASLSGKRPTLLVFFSGDAVEYTTIQGDGRRGVVKRGETVFFANHEDSIKNIGASKLDVVVTEFLTDGKQETWNMSGLAPNYKMILENQYARTYDIRIPAQSFEPQHTHHERIVICLSGAQLEHILPNGEKQPSTLKSGEVAWRPAATHIGHNFGHTDLWVIAIEPK
jgi:hypothetical protein